MQYCKPIKLPFQQTNSNVIPFIIRYNITYAKFGKCHLDNKFINKMVMFFFSCCVRNRIPQIRREHIHHGCHFVDAVPLLPGSSHFELSSSLFAARLSQRHNKRWGPREIGNIIFPFSTCTVTC